MAQLTVYLDEKTRRRIERAAREGDVSVSQWVKDKLTQALERDWPAGYFDLFGSLKDSDLARPAQPPCRLTLRGRPRDGPYFLDANICIYALKDTFRGMADRVRRHTPAEIKIAAIVRAELQFGARKSASSARTRELLERFLSPYEVVPFDSTATDAYADLRFNLEQKGTPIGPNDMILAATVLASDGCLVTHNTQEFRRVKRLRIEDWTQ